MSEVEIFSGASPISVDRAVSQVNNAIQTRLAGIKATTQQTNWRIRKIDLQFRYNPPDKHGEHVVLATAYFERF